jgi:hypothetical protein
MLAALSDNAQPLSRLVFTDVGICRNDVTIKEAAMLGLPADCVTTLWYRTYGNSTLTGGGGVEVRTEKNNKNSLSLSLPNEYY